MKESPLDRLLRWIREGKTGVSELVEEHNEQVRQMAYERDVHYLLEDIERKYPMLISRRDEIMELLHSKKII